VRAVRWFGCRPRALCEYTHFFLLVYCFWLTCSLHLCVLQVGGASALCGEWGLQPGVDFVAGEEGVSIHGSHTLPSLPRHSVHSVPTDGVARCALQASILWWNADEYLHRELSKLPDLLSEAVS
jgi:hypothetical protein